MGAAANRHKAWCCPFFKWDGKMDVHCEGGSRITFPSKAATDRYLSDYCAANPAWEKCSIAAALLRYYDDLEEQENEKRRQDQRAGKSK